MKKLLSLALVVLMMLSAFVPSLAVPAESIPADDGISYCWLNDGVLDPETNQVTVSIHIENRGEKGFQGCEFAIYYPKCLKIVDHTYGTMSSSASVTLGKMNEEYTRYITQYALDAPGNAEIIENYGISVPDKKAYAAGERGDWYCYTHAFSYDAGGDEHEVYQNTYESGTTEVITFQYVPEEYPEIAAKYQDKIPVIALTDTREPDGLFLDYYTCDDEETHGYIYAPDREKLPAENFVYIPKDEPKVPTMKAEDVTIEAGDATATVNVNIENNPGVQSVTSIIAYDANMDLISIAAGDVFAQNEFMHSAFNVPYENVSSMSGFWKRVPGILADFGVSTDNIKVAGTNAMSNDMYNNVTTDGRYITLTFDTSKLAPGTYTIWAGYSPVDTLNMELSPVKFEVVPCTLTVVEHVCDHVWVAGDVKEPTCTEGGYTEYTCSECGATKKDNFTDALGHDITEVVEKVDPTCTEAGYTVYKCVRCDETETRDRVDALGHDFSVKVETVEPTCAAGGYTTYKCSRCDATEQRDLTEAIPHNFVATDTKVEPTCTEQGYTVYECTMCGAKENRDYVDALGHDITVVVEKVDPTCTEKGYTTYKCVRCDETETRDYVDALGHDYSVKGATVEPTCTTGGYTTYKCSRCDATENRDFTDALGHDITEVVEKVDPTCTEKGYTVYKCVRCDETETRDYVDALGHDYSVKGATVEPTCTSGGYTTYKCSRCDATENRDIKDALGHDITEVVEKVEPTCTEKGYTVYKCVRCDATETRDYVDATGHDYSELVEKVEPTCTEEGYTAYKCTKCGDITKTDIVDALGHEWDAGVITKAPTTDAEGEKTFTCQRCKETKVEAVAKLEAPAKDDNNTSDNNNTGDNKTPANNQTGDAMTLIVFIALISLVSGAAVVITKKKIYNR